MNTNQHHHRYLLESPRVTGRRQQKTTCPSCGRRRCFVRYVDTHNDCRYLSDEVGACDHKNSCGYHYPPAAYFHDHPWQRPNDRSVCGGITTTKTTPINPPAERPLQPLPMTYVEQSTHHESTFGKWLRHIGLTSLGSTEADIARVMADYHLGATLKGDVIYWQIDTLGRVRSGHIMRYGPDGHRQGYQSWVHTRLMLKGRLPPDFQLRQCLYGEHLLARRPDATVCLVESEKTALLMALRHPRQLWLATCGCEGLSVAKMEPLRGRRVVVFPDASCYAKWLARMQQTEDIAYTVSQALESWPPNTDLADVLLAAT